MNIKIGVYQLTSDAMQFIVNKIGIVQESRLTKTENVGKEMIMNKGKWMYQLGNSNIWNGEEFETKEEALKEGLKARDGDEKLSIGQQESVGVSGIDIDSLLESVAENTTSEVAEVGEDFLMDVETEHQEELEQKLNDVFFEWINEHRYNPSFYKIVNIEEVEGDK